MAGLRNICKMYGQIKLDGVIWVWDYSTDEPRIKSEMTKEEIAASDRAKCESPQRR